MTSEPTTPEPRRRWETGVGGIECDVCGQIRVCRVVLTGDEDEPSAWICRPCYEEVPMTDATQARLDNHYGYCTSPPDHDGPCGPIVGGAHRETCATTYGMDCDLSCAPGGAS